MAREGVDVYNIGESTEDIRQALIDLRADFEMRKDSDLLKLTTLYLSNLFVTGDKEAAKIGLFGKDPQSVNIWGLIMERGYGVHVRYEGANYGRIFIDATNDGGHSTPSMIIDLPSPNKLVLKDNENHTIWRTYGRGAQEVGFSSNYFNGYGAFDLFAPMRLLTYDYNGGTTGGPESAAGGAYEQDGFIYFRQNYGAGLISDFRGFQGNSWKSFVMFHPEATPGNPFIADNVSVREVVTVTIA